MLPRALKMNHPDVPAAVKSIKGSVPVNAVVVFHGHHVKCSKPHVPDAARLLKCLSNQQVKSLFIAKTATSPADHASRHNLHRLIKSPAVLNCRAFFMGVKGVKGTGLLTTSMKRFWLPCKNSLISHSFDGKEQSSWLPILIFA